MPSTRPRRHSPTSRSTSNENSQTFSPPPGRQARSPTLGGLCRLPAHHHPAHRDPRRDRRTTRISPTRPSRPTRKPRRNPPAHHRIRRQAPWRRRATSEHRRSSLPPRRNQRRTHRTTIHELTADRKRYLSASRTRRDTNPPAAAENEGAPGRAASIDHRLSARELLPALVRDQRLSARRSAIRALVPRQLGSTPGPSVCWPHASICGCRRGQPRARRCECRRQ
jgi:hypothetical protein